MKLFGSSGIRTVFSGRLLDIAFNTGMAVGRSYPRVVIGTDTRTSSPALKHAVCAGVLAGGGECADAGIMPTPTLALLTRDYSAGVMITASHNPPEYNGIKLLNPDGSSFGGKQQASIEAEMEKPRGTVKWNQIKNDVRLSDGIDLHIQKIAADFPRLPRVKIVVDAAGGAASIITPRLLEKLGCDVIRLNCEYSGFFERPSEPTEKNLAGLCEAVKANEAAAGIAHDGDADRMMAVDERGRFISGDKLLALLLQHYSRHEIVTTLDASMVIDEMDRKVYRTRIGDTWVSEELKERGDFGGETSGAWIFPAISYCPDGIYAAAALAAMLDTAPLSSQVDALPSYPLLRGNRPGADIDFTDLEAKLKYLEPVSVDKTDGLKVVVSDGWILIRPSGTEPKTRLTIEAKTESRMHELYQATLEAIDHHKPE